MSVRAEGDGTNFRIGVTFVLCGLIMWCARPWQVAH